MSTTATIEINETSYTLEVETSVSNNADLLEVATTSNQNLEALLSNNAYTLEIEAISSQSLELNSGYVGSVVFASDVIGLENYLSDFIDTYNIDCGTP
jgi:hypothetical protein